MFMMFSLTYSLWSPRSIGDLGSLIARDTVKQDLCHRVAAKFPWKSKKIPLSEAQTMVIRKCWPENILGLSQVDHGLTRARFHCHGTY